jgi:hypothetical protein
MKRRLRSVPIATIPKVMIRIQGIVLLDDCIVSSIKVSPPYLGRKV